MYLAWKSGDPSKHKKPSQWQVKDRNKIIQNLEGLG